MTHQRKLNNDFEQELQLKILLNILLDAHEYKRMTLTLNNTYELLRKQNDNNQFTLFNNI